MPATLYIRPQPRAFFLLTTTHALIFRQPDARESKASRTVVVAEFLPIGEVDVRGLVRASKTRTVEGVLGVTSVPTDRSPVPEIFLVLISAATPLSPLLPSSSLRPARVLSVEFHSLSSSFWDPPEFSLASNPLNEYDPDDFHSSSSYNAQASTQSQAAQQGVENPCNGMRRYIESGGFFFAEGGKWDISTRMGETNCIQAEKGQAQHPLETYDERFVWNATLLAPFLAFRSGLPEETRRKLDEQSLLIPVIQGFCGSLPVTTGSWTPGGRADVASLAIISRLSWKRAGARFRTRGIDDDGQVANFVETEVILALGGVCLSYVQVRGSVPLFWQQPSQGIQTLQQRVELTRPPQATQPAFDKHFLDLLEHYHSIHAVNLLGQRDAESMLSAAYSDHLVELKSTLDRTPASEKQGMDAATGKQTLDLTPYDFHAVVREHGHDAVKYDFSTGLREVVQSADNFGWTTVDINSGQVIEQQQGAFRVNCLDCLDRTNYVQEVISSIVLSRFLYSLDSMLASSPTFWTAHRTLWADNGDRLSKIYAGTGALNTSATRTGKKTFAGLLSDATKSVGRAYINNFQDKGKQNAIDMLLGMMSGQRPVVLFDPISDSVQSALHSRLNEYSRTRNVTIFSGTWNLNGKVPDESLDSWLFPPGAENADIYAIAFQEIVVLNAQQILQTDPAKRRRWEAFVMEHFAKRELEYLLLRSEQLVGAALIVIVKQDLSKSIRSVEAATKKTGLSGLSGNKGGVGIRLNLFDTSVCLMTAHLAAGHSNVTERNADYRTISTGLKFLKGKMIDDHDIVIFEGDFNYRISLPNDDVRHYAETDQLDQLLDGDQLVTAMDQGEAFDGYDEGPITFRPTYKYDNGTDEYDSSEKQRIPAWTDRVLFKGPALRLKAYHRAELRTSDHRPVYAVFEATVREIDEARKESITEDIVREIRKTGGTDSNVDEKIERGLQGGLGGLVKEMTHATITPSLTPRTQTPQPPPIPSRPTPSTLRADEDALTRSRSGSGPPPLPRRGSPAPAKLSVSPNSSDPHSAMPLAARREPPPRPASNGIVSDPVPNQTFKPTSSTVDAINRRRAAPAVPSGSSSSTSMPPPPPLLAPRPTISVDLDDSPPDGLVTPVQPTAKSTPGPSLPARKPTLPAATASSANTDAASTPKLPDRKPVPPPAPTTSKQSGLSKGETATLAPTAGTRQANGTKTGSVADRLKQWEQFGAQSGPKVAIPKSAIQSASSVPSSPIKRASETRHAPPSVPKKPDTLRKPSTDAPPPSGS